MKEFTQEQFQQKLSTVPKKITDILFSKDTGDVLHDICNMYDLHIDQANELGKENTYLTLGMTSAQEFIKRIQKKLGVSEPIADQIAEDLDKKVLQKIRLAYTSAQKQSPDIPPSNSQPAIVTTTPQDIQPTYQKKDPYREPVE